MAKISRIQRARLGYFRRLDAEYYQPEHLKMDADFEANKYSWEFLDSLSQPKITKGETPLWRGDEYAVRGVPFVRSENLLPCFVDTRSVVFIPPKVDERMRRSRVSPGDVLIAIVGATTGVVGLVPDFVERANINQAVARVRNPTLNKYLSVFLLSGFAQAQIERFSGGGAARDNLDLHEVKRLRIVLPPQGTKQAIDRLVDRIADYYNESDRLYIQAERMLLEEVRFDKVNLSWSRGYVIDSKEARVVSRIDAEHFQPKYPRVIKHLVETGKACKVDDVLSGRVEKGVTPEYTEQGVAAVNSQHLGRCLLNFESVDHTPEAYWAANRRAQIKRLDVLVYATGAYIGRTNCYLESTKAFAGVDILIVRPNQKCNPIYLATFLNSPLGTLQAEQWASGSAQRHLYPDDIAAFTLYLPSSSFQQRIAELVTAAHEARAKAKKLLEEAKREVEDLIVAS